MKRWIVVSLFLSINAFAQASNEGQPNGWKAGVARVAITPREPIWMAGYAARKAPSEGALHDLWAKALVLEDSQGNRAALITLDLCGIDDVFSAKVRDELQARLNLDRSRVVLACSHTHSGPVVGTNLITMYPLDEAQRERVEAYTRSLHDMIVSVAVTAAEAVVPASLAWGQGQADFGINRRNNDQGRVPELREAISIQGPNDHDVPVLRIEDADGTIFGIVCGYACHCTTLSGGKLSGDYAGFAQDALEARHPGAVALFVAGCGADINPLPRGEVAQAQQYGQELADAVDRVLKGPMTALDGPLRTAYEEVGLAFSAIPGREQWESLASSENVYEANRAKKLLAILDRDGELSASYRYPVQAWRFGDRLTWVFLGGEVVVDYALRLKRSLGGSRTWVSAYCNDVMAYIPSLRVLQEGGYEGGGAMLYYAQPAPWSEKVEDQVIAGIKSVLDATRGRESDGTD